MVVKLSKDVNRAFTRLPPPNSDNQSYNPMTSHRRCVCNTERDREREKEKERERWIERGGRERGKERETFLPDMKMWSSFMHHDLTYRAVFASLQVFHDAGFADCPKNKQKRRR